MKKAPAFLLRESRGKFFVFQLFDDDVTFNISENYTDPWTFTSSDGRFEADFVPIIDRSDFTSVANLIVTDQHQVFGRMTGKAILDDKTVIEFKDFLCFAERVHNKY